MLSIAAGNTLKLSRNETTTLICLNASSRHQGTAPRFMAQPPLHSAEPIQLERVDGNYSPVEIAIRQALQGGGLVE